MNLLKQFKHLCALYGIKPARSKGQNFLIKEEIYEKIIEAACLSPEDVVLEVGPGLGVLTFKLAKIAKKVIAVELDDKLAEILRTGLETRKIKNVEVVNEDILKLEIRNLKSAFADSKFQTNFKVVANLPYNITSVFLRKFLSAEIKPELMVLLLQKEVAERITAKPPKMSLLAVSAQFYSQPEIIALAPASCFWPQPAVDGTLIKLKIPACRTGGKKEKLKINEKEYFRLVKIGFSSKRKMLKNNLANGYHLDQKAAEEKIVQAGFDPKIRAQELGVEDWLRLFPYFSECG